MRFTIILLLVTMLACRANPSLSKVVMTSPKAKATAVLKPDDEVWVMVIDTGIGKHDKLTNVEYIDADDYVDNHGHGTHVAGIIQYGNNINAVPGKIDFSDGLCKNVKIFSCKYFDPKAKPDSLKSATDCVNKATDLKMDYINYSGGGSQFSLEEYDAYRRYTESGGTAVVAAGNESSRLSDRPYYPASYASNDGFSTWKRSQYVKGGARRFVPLRLQVVQNIDRSGKLVHSSNTHPFATSEVGYNVFSTQPNNLHSYMTGTSQATPAVLHTILKQECVRLNGKK